MSRKNTRFEYVYRDGANYKYAGPGFVAKGEISPSVMERLSDGEYFFIAEELGVKPVQPRELTSEDHVYHSVEEVFATDQEPNIALDADTVAKKLYADDWDESKSWVWQKQIDGEI